MNIWVVQDLEVTDHVLFFTEEHLAHHACQKIVGNRACAQAGDGFLYGPGDGSTRVMMRLFPRDLVQRMWPDHNIPVRE